MTITLRISNADLKLFKKYALKHNMSLSCLLRKSVIEKIENEYDLEAYKKAEKEFNNDSTTYSLNEVEKKLGLAN